MIYDFLVQNIDEKETVGNDSEGDDQSSPGVLNDSQSGQFVTTGEEIAELPIASIRPCRNIPDYRDLTESTLPIVVQSPDACQCIDGWNLIEQAQAEGIQPFAAMFLKSSGILKPNLPSAKLPFGRNL